MKWILLLAFLMPLKSAATIIDYRFTGSATDLTDYTSGHDVVIDFSIDPETTFLKSFEMTFQGDLWTPNERPPINCPFFQQSLRELGLFRLSG